MKKKIISVMVACCFLNTALYSSAAAFALPGHQIKRLSYHETGGKKLPGAPLQHERLDASLPGPLAEQIQGVQELDVTALLQKAQDLIDQCLARLDACHGSANGALSCIAFRNALLGIRHRVESLSGGAGSGSDGQAAAAVPVTTISNFIEMVICLAALVVVIDSYGLPQDAVTPAAAYEIYLLSYSVLLSLLIINEDPAQLRLLKTFETVLTYTALSVFYLTALQEGENELIGIELAIRLLVFPLP